MFTYIQKYSLMSMTDERETLRGDIFIFYCSSVGTSFCKNLEGSILVPLRSSFFCQFWCFQGFYTKKLIFLVDVPTLPPHLFLFVKNIYSN